MQRWCRGPGTEDGTLLASVLCYQGVCCVWFSIGVVQQRCMCRMLGGKAAGAAGAGGAGSRHFGPAEV